MSLGSRSLTSWAILVCRQAVGVVAPVAAYLKDVQACGRSEATLRSYGMDLLRWFRFCWAIGVPWDQATRSEARDFCRWIQIAAKPGGPRRRTERGGSPVRRLLALPRRRRSGGQRIR